MKYVFGLGQPSVPNLSMSCMQAEDMQVRIKRMPQINAMVEPKASTEVHMAQENWSM